MKHKKITRIEKLKLEIAIKDKIISSLVTVISESNIKLSDKMIKMLELLYKKNETDKGEQK